MTQGIHTLDLMLSLAGPIVEVSGYARTTPVHRMETEDMVCAAVRFASGAVGVIDATTAAYPGGPERIELIGTQGTAVARAARRSTVHYHDGRRESVAADASPAAPAPTRWPSRTTIIWACGAISSTRSISGRPPRVSGRRGAQGASPDRRAARGRQQRAAKSPSADRAAALGDACGVSLLLASCSRGGWQGCASISHRVSDCPSVVTPPSLIDEREHV